MKKWVLGSLGAALLVALLGLAVLPHGDDLDEPRGESLPQFTARPGLRPQPGALWGTPDLQLYSPVESPQYVSAEEAAAFLDDKDPVYLIRQPGSTYVYPEVLLTSYHVVNDTIDGEPVAVTFCLLAGTASRLSRKMNDRVLTLGVTGQLYCGNSVLYDQETRTDWLQLNGEPLRGHYHGRARLAAKSLERSSWRRVKKEQGLKVLAPLRAMAEYRAFYRDMQAERLGQKVVQSQLRLDPRLLPYVQGLGLLVQGEARFYPEDPQREPFARNDTVGGWSILLYQDAPGESPKVFRRQQAGRVLEFDLAGGVLRDRQTGSRWDERGVCVEGSLSGSRLEVPFYSNVYWFVWSTLYPQTSLQ